MCGLHGNIVLYSSRSVPAMGSNGGPDDINAENFDDNRKYGCLSCGESGPFVRSVSPHTGMLQECSTSNMCFVSQN